MQKSASYNKLLFKILLKFTQAKNISIFSILDWIAKSIFSKHPNHWKNFINKCNASVVRLLLICRFHSKTQTVFPKTIFPETNNLIIPTMFEIATEGFNRNNYFPRALIQLKVLITWPTPTTFNLKCEYYLIKPLVLVTVHCSHIKIHR